MKFLIPTFILAFSLMLSSCEKEIDFKGDVSAPRLVLNGIVELDSNFTVFLERSTFFLDNSPQSSQAISEGATLIVKNLDNNQTYSMNASTEGNRYVFPFTVTPNTRYSIEVSHPDYPSISSEMKTLSGVQIISVDTSSYEQNFDSRLRFEVKWNDNASEENYYLVQVILTDVWDEGSYTYPLYVSSTDPAVDNSGNTGIDGSLNDVPFLALSDATFNGGQKTLKFESYNPFYWGGDETTLKIQIISMSKEVFMYKKSVDLFLQQDFFSEPVKVFSNILNGFGIFGFTSTSSWDL